MKTTDRYTKVAVSEWVASAIDKMRARWFPEALKLAISKDLGDGCSAQVVSPSLFLATKLEAFKDRGKGDYYLSHDLEDIITVVDGCASIVGEVNASGAGVKAFISRGFSEILNHPDFSDALPGHHPEKLRIPLVLDRFVAIATLIPG